VTRTRLSRLRALRSQLDQIGEGTMVFGNHQRGAVAALGTAIARSIKYVAFRGVMVSVSSAQGEGGTMTTLPEYDHLDATDLAGLIARREVTPLEVLDAAIERAEQRDPAINSITLKLFDRAREAARTQPAAGPFGGVPFLLKDLGAWLTGTVSSASTKLFEGWVADHDSTIVERHRASGLNIFGRSSTPELGMATSTEPAM